MGSADELLASRDVERPQAACSVSCTIVSVERVSVFECCKDIRPRLSKDKRRVNTTFARVHTLTCHTVHVLRSLRIKHTSHRSRIPRSAPRHPRHCRRSSTACARSAQRARQRWLRAGTCTVTPPPCCATASTQALDRPTNERPRGSPASPDARAVPPTRPARPLPRALAARRACCALLPRPHPCPLPSLPTAQCPQRLSRLRSQLRQRTKSWLPPPQRLKPGPCTRRSQRGIAKVQDTRHARGQPRTHGRRDRFRDAERRPAAMPIESMSTRAIALVTSDRVAGLQDSKR